jgi:hypothetical protein
MMKPEFEYFIFSIPPQATDKALSDLFTEYGMGGWELTAVYFGRAYFSRVKKWNKE